MVSSLSCIHLFLWALCAKTYYSYLNMNETNQLKPCCSVQLAYFTCCIHGMLHFVVQVTCPVLLVHVIAVWGIAFRRLCMHLCVQRFMLLKARDSLGAPFNLSHHLRTSHNATCRCTHHYAAVQSSIDMPAGSAFCVQLGDSARKA